MEDDDLAWRWSDITAFEWLDRDFQYAATHEMWSPDEAFDFITKMKNSDWEALEKAWFERNAGWRSICVYVLGQGPPEKCSPLLKRGLQDEDFKVATEAARSLGELSLMYQVSDVELDEQSLQLLKDLARRNSTDIVEDFRHLLKD